MTRRSPARRGSRAAGRRSPASGPAAGGSSGRRLTGEPGTPEPQEPAGPADLAARIGFALGAMAFLALPIAYQWTFRPATRPPGTDVLVQLLELGGILAAAAALFLGRRARAAGDRSSSAVWAPRLGAAAIVGYVMTLVLVVARPA